MTTTKTKEELSVDFIITQLKTCKTKEDFMLSFWIHWSESVTVTDREFQKVMASAAVNKWFLFELKKQEDEFDLLSSRYNNLTSTDTKTLYAKCASKLMSRFPLALLQEAKKRELKPQTTKVSGIKIEFSLINLN
jgi:hypothetical protein